jgi:hypothetical protein
MNLRRIGHSWGSVAQLVLTGGDRDGNAVYSRSSSARRIAALLETGARQESARPLARHRYLAASSELCGEWAKRSQPRFFSIVSDALNIPLRERNVLLLASGYAPLYSEQSMDADQMAIVNHAIGRMLQQQEPHPALVLDRYWNVIRTNQAAPRFFGSFVDLEMRPKPRNLLDLMFDPAGMRPFVEEWEKVAAGLLQRVRREAVGQVVDKGLQRLLETLRKYPGVAELKPPLAPQGPVLPVTFRRGNERFSYFSLITTVGAPQCITAQELRVECMFPTHTRAD